MSPSIKLLRVIVDKQLSWMDNINLEENKFSKNPALLYKTKSFLDGKEVTSIYYSFLRCCLNYGNLTWCSASLSKPK